VSYPMGGEGPDGRWRDVLDFERTWWKAGASKDAAIRERLGLAPIHYYQVLNRAIDLRAALEYDPILVRRLRRLRDRRRRMRFGPPGHDAGALRVRPRRLEGEIMAREQHEGG